MIRFILSSIIFLLFIIEGSLFQIFAPELYDIEFTIVPHFVVVVIVVIGIFYGRPMAILYGIIFGFLYDVVYTEILGVYAFVFGLSGYIFSLELRPVQNSYFYNFLLAVSAVLFVEYFVYGFLYLFELTRMSHVAFLLKRLLPTLAINAIFILIILYPLRWLIFYYKKKEDPMAM